MFTARVREFFKQNRPISTLIVSILVLTTIPVLDMLPIIENGYQGIPPSFDDTFYLPRVQAIVKGDSTAGNPYFYEHRDGPPLVILAGTWLSALPQLAGVPLMTALFLNFIIWSLAFALALYWLFRELRAPPWVAVAGTILLFLGSYGHVWRVVNLQTVYPFYFLFYIALLRFIREQSRRNSWLLAATIGVSFYIFPYLWQMIGLILVLFILSSLIRKDWQLTKAAIQTSLIGGLIGLPVPLYILWLSHSSPYFWESMGRLGLVNTRVPMAEVFYSGGWIGLMLALVAVLYVRVQALRNDADFVRISFFIVMSGLGLWIMQGSNLITGKLLETGEHVRLFIFPWLAIVIVSIALFLWKQHIEVSGRMKVFSVMVLLIVAIPTIQFSYGQLESFLPAGVNRPPWQLQQSYAKPFAWLDAHEKNPVVVWSDPHDALSANLPMFTRHFTLYTYFGMLELVPEGEIRERYLVSQYFNDPSLADLKSDTEMGLYLGRHDFPHYAKTIERGIKLCRILFFWDKQKDCGTPPTPREILGEQFFITLENKFQNDIKPNIRAYLAKYHVSYILKDKILDPKYYPEALGAVRVYADDRYEIYHL